MQAANIHTRKPLDRRCFLRGTGAALLSLPLLDAMLPSLGRRAIGAAKVNSPKRFVGMCATLGFHGPLLFPKTTGPDYELTPYLEPLEQHRDQLTIFSGLSHPDQQGNNGHASEITWLTSARRPGLPGFRNTISLDQLIAAKIGTQTRFPSLSLSTSGRSMSWTASGVEIPGQTSPAKLFQALFVDGTKDEVAAEISGLQRGRSILDTIRGEAKKLEQDLGRRDREKLEEYLAAVRDLESRLVQSQSWSRKAKPKVADEPPTDVTNANDAIARQQLMYDMIVLALQTDSTRTITFQLSGLNAVPLVEGVNNDWHQLSHHGKDPAKLDELKLIELAQFRVFNGFLTKLNGVMENGRTLLDHTAVLYGSNLGNASAHDWHNLPILLAGGGYRHGDYVAFDPKQNLPLANLFVALGQRMGLEIRRFGSSTAESVQGFTTKG